MKNRNSKWKIRTAAALLAGVCLCAGVALAAGDKDDPLITLSYLTQTATPEILEKVEESGAKKQTELLEKFNAAIDKYKQEDSTDKTDNAEYAVVSMTKGQTMQLGVGCEIMLRVGSATVSAQTSPALIDVSTGSGVNSGAALTANHLYMATIADRTLTATADTVKLMVRGSYTLA